MLPGRFFVRIFSLVLLFPATVLQARDLPVSTQFPEGFPTIDELRFQTTDGKEVAGEDLLGQAVAVVFLKPTCPKCTVKIPGVERSYQTFKEEGFSVVAVSSSGDREPLTSLQRRYGYDWIWTKNSSEIKKQLDNHTPFEILVFDQAGIPRFRIDEHDKKWKVHLELCLGASLERALDLSAFPRGYVGSAVCGICHMEEWNQWNQTPHATSMTSLRKKQNHHKVECVRCHVTGEAGKEVRPWRLTPRELQEVGCEECHGPGGPHRTDPYPGAEIYSTEESSCIRCHDEKNSPDWDYESYLGKVVHKASAEESEGVQSSEGSTENTPPAEQEAEAPCSATDEQEASSP